MPYKVKYMPNWAYINYKVKSEMAREKKASAERKETFKNKRAENQDKNISKSKVAKWGEGKDVFKTYGDFPSTIYTSSLTFNKEPEDTYEGDRICVEYSCTDNDLDWDIEDVYIEYEVRAVWCGNGDFEVTVTTTDPDGEWDEKYSDGNTSNADVLSGSIDDAIYDACSDASHNYSRYH